MSPKPENVAGKRFGHFVVVDDTTRYPKGKSRRVLVQCDCGSSPKSVELAHLKKGDTVSCGCYRKSLGNGLGVSKQISLNDRFGRLKVIEIIYFSDRKHRKFARVVCDCGSEPKQVSVYALLNGDTKSCGCLNDELKAAKKTHGKSEDRIYGMWVSMVQRATNPKHVAFARYGGRNIGIDPRWVSSFAAFYADMGEPPPGMSIDRIDNDQGYWKGNCRWATPRMQQRNTKRTIFVEINGERIALVDLVERLGTTKRRIAYYKNSRGISWSEAARHFVEQRQ